MDIWFIDLIMSLQTLEQKANLKLHVIHLNHVNLQNNI